MPPQSDLEEFQKHRLITIQISEKRRALMGTKKARESGRTDH